MEIREYRKQYRVCILMVRTCYMIQTTDDAPDEHVDRPGHVLPLADEDVEHDAVEDHPDQAHDGLEGPEVGELVPGPDDHIRGVVGGGVGGRGEGEGEQQYTQQGQGATPEGAPWA